MYICGKDTPSLLKWCVPPKSGILEMISFDVPEDRWDTYQNIVGNIVGQPWSFKVFNDQ